MTRNRTDHSPAPSTMAASRRLEGSALMKLRSSSVVMARPNEMWMMIIG